MNKNIRIAVASLFASACLNAIAGTEIDELKDRITALESIKSSIEFGGVIEVEYGSADNADGMKQLWQQ